MLSGYTYEEIIPITAPVGGLSQGAVVFFDKETYELININKCRPDRKDYRVVYFNGSNEIEIDRIMITTGRIAFRLQSSLSSEESTNNYKVNYGNSSESTTPLQDPHNVWNHYFDGSTSDINSLSKTGSNINQVSMPCPKLIKYGQGPVLSIHTTPPSGTTCTMIREVRYFDDTDNSGYYYAHYIGLTVSGSDQETLSRSTDLINWEHVKIVEWNNEPAIGFAGTIISKFPWQIDGQNLYYCSTVKADHVDVNGIGMPPYTLWGGYSTSPEGPWTASPSGTPLINVGGEYDTAYCVDGEIKAFWNGSSYTYYIPYGAASYNHGQYVGYATASHPLGPYTKQAPFFRSGGENPKLFFDDNYAYITVNPIGGYNCQSNNLFWCPSGHWNESAYWDNNNCVRMMEGTPEGWDAYAINDTGVPIIKNGMIYFSYAGYGQEDYHSGQPHRYFSGGLIEGKWPFDWDNAISVGSGSTISTSAGVLESSAEGEIVVRIKLYRDSSGFKIFGNTETYLITCTETIDEEFPEYVYGTFTITVNGSPVTPILLPNNDTAESRSWTFRRINGQIKIYVGGIKAWESSIGASTEKLDFMANANTIVESVQSYSINFLTEAMIPFEMTEMFSETFMDTFELIAGNNIRKIDGSMGGVIKKIDGSMGGIVKRLINGVWQ